MAVEVLNGRIVGDLEVVVVGDGDPVLCLILVPNSEIGLLIFLMVSVDDHVECFNIRWRLTNFLDTEC
jgi:hypothetical protein